MNRQSGKELEERARALYEACPVPKPTWEQLGDVTRSVWRERAEGLLLRAERGGLDEGTAPGPSQRDLF